MSMKSKQKKEDRRVAKQQASAPNAERRHRETTAYIERMRLMRRRLGQQRLRTAMLSTYGPPQRRITPKHDYRAGEVADD